MNHPIKQLSLQAVSKKFESNAQLICVLDSITMSFERGNSYAICGISGTGKSTLLRILAGLEKPSSGNVLVDGNNLLHASNAGSETFRTEAIGFVFQEPRLIDALSVCENVIVKALWSARKPYQQLLDEAIELLARVGLFEKRFEKISALSGGQQQRVSLARALFARPSFLIADEPTGSLDEQTGTSIIELMREYQREWGMGLIISTHDKMVSSYLQNMFVLREGKLLVHS